MIQGKSDRYSRALEDGRYLVRPHGAFGAVYNVDEETKERFLKYRRIAGAPAILIFIVGSLMQVPAMALLVILCGWAIVDISVRQSRVKAGFRVNRKEWQPLPTMDTGPLFPRWAYFIFVPILLVLEWASLGSIYNLYSSGYGIPPESWVLVALWTFFLWLCWRDVRKKAPKSPAFQPEAGPEDESRRDSAPQTTDSTHS